MSKEESAGLFEAMWEREVIKRAKTGGGPAKETAPQAKQKRTAYATEFLLSIDFITVDNKVIFLMQLLNSR